MARVLFITQEIDLDDDVLGVYHRWIERLSDKVEKLNVICLYHGRDELPKRVGVYSLGKEVKPSRIKYIINFYKYIWGLRRDYDVVFVHMNPVYIVLGGCFWKLWGKKILLWYNHPMGNLMARVGVFLSDKVFCTSSYSFATKYSKAVLMPVGIDTLLFKSLPNVQKRSNRILFLGRISPIKKIELLVKAAKLLDAQGVDFELLVVGSATSRKDKAYELKLVETASSLIVRGKIVFRPSVPNYKTPEIYNSSGIFVNLTPTGSFDKAILEAMACEVPILVSNKTLKLLLPKGIGDLCVFEENNADDLSQKISFLFSLDDSEMRSVGEQCRELIVMNHGLDSLIENLAVVFDKTQQDKNQLLKINA